MWDRAIAGITGEESGENFAIFTIPVTRYSAYSGCDFRAKNWDGVSVPTYCAYCDRYPTTSLLSGVPRSCEIGNSIFCGFGVSFGVCGRALLIFRVATILRRASSDILFTSLVL